MAADDLGDRMKAYESAEAGRRLQDKSSSQMQELLFQKGVNWNDYPAFFKRGTFVLRRARVG